jgi:hypothetical protein
LTVAALAAGAISLCSLAVPFLVLDYQHSRHELRQRLSNWADVVSQSSTTALTANDPALGTETMRALQAEPAMAAGCLYGAQGQLLAEYQRAGNVLTCPATAAELPASPLEFIAERRTVYAGGEQVGCLYLLADLQALHSADGN